MKGFDKAGRVLEFDRITERLASLAATEGAAEALRSLQPADDGASVNRLLDQTADARAMMTVKSQPPFGRAKNITPHIERAVKGATLTTRELLDVASLLRTVGALIKYGAGGGAGLRRAGLPADDPQRQPDLRGPAGGLLPGSRRPLPPGQPGIRGLSGRG